MLLLMHTSSHIEKEFVLTKLVINQGNNNMTLFLPSSLIHWWSSIELIYTVFKDFLTLSGRYNGFFSYGQSKLANILHANHLSSILKVLIFLWYFSDTFTCREHHLQRYFISYPVFLTLLKLIHELL